MGLGSLQGVHNASERVAFSFCLPRQRKRPITQACAFRPPFNFTSCLHQCRELDQAPMDKFHVQLTWWKLTKPRPGSHTVLALILLQLSIAIYSLEVKLSNPFWVNPAFLVSGYRPALCCTVAYLSLLSKCFHLMHSQTDFYWGHGPPFHKTLLDPNRESLDLALCRQSLNVLHTSTRKATVSQRGSSV